MTSRASRVALGLMSGTSLDGIDGAIVRTDGERILALGPASTVPYDAPFRDRLRAVLGEEAKGLPERFGDLAADTEALRKGRRFSGEPLIQGLTVQPLHREVTSVCLVVSVGDISDDGRVPEGGQ